MTVSSLTALNVAPGSVVVVRDEEWLVTATEVTDAGKMLLHVQGLSELVQDTTAQFYETLDRIEVLDPNNTRVIGDDSSKYRDTRLWLEANFRKTAVPLAEQSLTVSTSMLADTLKYQEAAVRKALNPENLKPRILLADAVGLGKTIEIGMILSELVRRGRGERILIVSPRHVLEQMQHEMWTRFGLPFVRLDSVGIQRVRQQLPATRNPFTFYKRAIISIDTLKSDLYLASLRKQKWDAVVIDEAHNLTNSQTQNNRLARILARNTDALILASATPHNGRKESFAELIRLLDPTAVSLDNDINEEEAERLIIRRHRHSPEVAREVGAQWAERLEPNNVLVPASAAEKAVAQELANVWLHPPTGQAPLSGKNSQLFPWTLAKAFLSSPAALAESIQNRMQQIQARATEPEHNREIQALESLQTLNANSIEDSAKFNKLVEYLKDQVKISAKSQERVVVFAERVPTLRWLREKLTKAFKLKAENVQILHGGLSDEIQQQIVESFKQGSSPIRILVTGDVASEGVNLHAQCHNLVHFDIPWSLIRIEQRNGRIDRYGQRTSPLITTLLVDTGDDRFSGDIRVLQSLVNKEHEAHKVLGDVSSLMGEYLENREEDAIRSVLMGAKTLDQVMRTPEQALLDQSDPVTMLLAQLGVDKETALALGGKLLDAPAPTSPAPVSVWEEDGPAAPAIATSGLFSTEIAYLEEAVQRIYTAPEEEPRGEGGGIAWNHAKNHGVASFTPPKDLSARLDVLPQTYLRDRRVKTQFTLATTRQQGQEALAHALSKQSDSSWPEAHFLGPLHPVLDWASDNLMAKLDRSSVFAVRTDVPFPMVAVHGNLTNKAGKSVASVYTVAQFLSVTAEPGESLRCITVPTNGLAEVLAETGLSETQSNPGALPEAERLTALIAPALAAAETQFKSVELASRALAEQRVDTWRDRLTSWDSTAQGFTQRREVKERRMTVQQEREAVEQMAPDRMLVRPLFVAVPKDFDCIAAGLLPVTETESVTESGMA